VDPARNREPSNDMFHHRDDRAFADGSTYSQNPDIAIPSTSRNTTAMDSAGDHNPDTSMHPSSGSSPTDTSPTTARDGDIEALTITRTQRAYHSFIIHTNITGEWKNNITRHARPGPTFVVYDHIDHLHILYSSLSGGGNPARTRQRICTFLGCTDAGGAEALITGIKFKDIKRFIFYCIRHGVQRMRFVGNRGRKDLTEVYALFNQLCATHAPDDIIQGAKCEPYHEQRKDVKKRLGSAKSRHLADIVLQKIDEYNTLSAQQWENKIPPELKLQLIKEFGLGLDTYIQRNIRIAKTHKTTAIKQQTMTGATENNGRISPNYRLDTRPIRGERDHPTELKILRHIEELDTQHLINEERMQLPDDLQGNRMSEHDNTGDQPPLKRHKRRPIESTTNMNDDDDDTTRPMGFGNTRPLSTRNIFPRFQVVPYMLRWQRMLDVNFRVGIRPYIIPYQTFSFWSGTWVKENSTTSKFYKP